MNPTGEGKLKAFDRELNEEDWLQIGDGILQGHYNLLLGAGVSLDSPSGIPEENCPSLSTLIEKLLDPNKGLKKNSSINRIYKNLSPEDIEKSITNRFSGCTAGPTVNSISQFRWKRIFTLNVDDALENSYENSDLPPQTIDPFNYNEPYTESRDPRRLPIIHLHGYARKPEGGYVFDLSEYMKTIQDNNIWAHILGQLIRTEPFIVIGTSLEEPDLSFFLADRNAASWRSGRPPSVLVEPFPDSGTSTDCDEYALKLFNGTAIDFLHLLDDKYPNRPRVDDAISDNLGSDIAAAIPDARTRAQFHSDFERVPGENQQGRDLGPLFALGHAPTWSDMQNERDIDRAGASDFQNKILKSSAGKTWLVSGDAGAGKTTILKRIAWNISRSGRNCFWLRSIGRIRADVAATALSAIKGRSYVFVDNFADNVVEIVKLREALKTKDIVFAGAERSYRNDHIKRVYGTGALNEWTVGAVGHYGAEALKASYRNLGLLAQAPDKLATPLHDEEIAIACCRIINNFEPLSAIIDRSIKDSSEPDRKCYLFASLASHCHRTGIEYNIISSKFPGYQVDVQSDSGGVLPLKIEESNGNEFVTPLNEALSDTILRRISREESNQVYHAFTSLASAIRPRVNPDSIRAGDPCALIAARLFDYDQVVKNLLGINGALDFFTDTENDWKWNSRYWHQISQLRLDLAEHETDPKLRSDLADMAVQHARFSKNIEERHQFTYTNLGRIIFGKFEVLGKSNSSEMEEAISSIQRAIQIEDRKNRLTIHPYMILLDGVEKEVKRGGSFGYEQKQHIKRRIGEARSKFSRDADLIAKCNNVQAML